MQDINNIEVTCWQRSTSLVGTKKERSVYFLTLLDGDRKIDFSLEFHPGDKLMVAVPYKPADYDYTEYDDSLEARVAREQWAYEHGLSEEEARELEY